MKYILSLIIMITLLGCGQEPETTTNTDEVATALYSSSQEPLLNTNSIEQVSQVVEKNATTTVQDIEQTTTKEISKETTTSQVVQESIKKIEKTVTIYVHGYSKSGYRKEGVYGNDNYDEVIDDMVERTGFKTTTTYDKSNYKNIIAITPYYGDTAPEYYTPRDTQDVEDIKGIPRYALIVAKYTRHIMQKTGADKVNYVSVSMGSLVTRFLIENNLENLASDKKITKWLSLEGVIKGNIVASSSNLRSIVDNFESQSIDVDHMDYSWIENHLDASSPYYNDIQIGFESSTKDNAHGSALSWWTRFNGDFIANDGVQAVRDTYFEADDATHTFFHDNHYSLTDNQAAWGYAATFLLSKKRLRITLIDAKLSDLHEDKVWFHDTKPADVVFESKVYSPLAERTLDFAGAIDERLLRGAYLKVYDYEEEDESQTLNQKVFDSYILEEERELSLSITPYELDREPDYGIKEITGHGRHESLGTATIMIPTQEGVYTLQGEDWSGHVKVELF